MCIRKPTLENTANIFLALNHILWMPNSNRRTETRIYRPESTINAIMRSFMRYPDSEMQKPEYTSVKHIRTLCITTLNEPRSKLDKGKANLIMTTTNIDRYDYHNLRQGEFWFPLIIFHVNPCGRPRALHAAIVSNTPDYPCRSAPVRSLFVVRHVIFYNPNKGRN